MKSIAIWLLVVFAACGSKAKPAESPPPATSPSATTTADDPDSFGITGDSAAAQACFEDCFENGPAGNNAGWAGKSNDERSKLCSGAACPEPKK